MAGVPGFKVTTSSSKTSKVAWRLFEKDENPGVQDSNEVTIKFVDVSQYRNGTILVDLEVGAEYCLRVYKGKTQEYGKGSNTLEVFWFDGFFETVRVNNSRIVLSSQGQKYKCFTARGDFLNKYPFSRVNCSEGEIDMLADAVGYWNGLDLLFLSEEARKVSPTTGLDGNCSDDKQCNAFHHCYFSCRFAQYIGFEQALEAGDIHESCDFYGDKQQNMDLYNNRVGASLDRGNSKDAKLCKSGCLAAATNKVLIWLN